MKSESAAHLAPCVPIARVSVTVRDDVHVVLQDIGDKASPESDEGNDQDDSAYVIDRHRGAPSSVAQCPRTPIQASVSFQSRNFLLCDRACRRIIVWDGLCQLCCEICPQCFFRRPPQPCVCSHQSIEIGCRHDGLLPSRGFNPRNNGRHFQSMPLLDQQPGAG